jgi:hypothetical protein
MPSLINSDDGAVSGAAGIKTTGSNDGLLNLQSNGSTIVAITGSGISVTGTVTQTGVSTFAAGTAAAPAITFTGDTNTGIYSPGADTIAFAEGGTEALRINSSAQVEFTAGSASTPSVTFTGDTNTGIYSPGADRIGFAEGGAQVGEFDASSNFLFNSGYGSVAIAYGCRAWVNFNGTTNVGGFCTIRASGNVSSVADNGVGLYTVNFANAFPDANYSLVATTEIVPTSSSTRSGYTLGIRFGTTPTASSVSLVSKNGANTAANAAEVDTNYANIAVFR